MAEEQKNIYEGDDHEMSDVERPSAADQVWKTQKDVLQWLCRSCLERERAPVFEQ